MTSVRRRLRLASQARIKGEELRKGRVAEQRWPKILKASQVLAAAPLWVDDSSDVGMLEIRAKARRLHSQCEGGLGLIIIDYLQLMRTDSRYDSRVTAVGELSRGLKILARELGVPVIASGGVGTLQHMVEGIRDGHATAVLAASIFHFGEHTVREAKDYMARAGLPVRLDP